MSLLSDRDIRAAFGSGALTIDPFEPELVQPASVDIRLGRRFRVFNYNGHTHIDPARDQPDLTREVVVENGDVFCLHTREFALATTLERVGLGPDLAGRVEGKSSLGRLGLSVHTTAGFIDPGFDGHITLELSNEAGLPILLYPGMKIAQLSLMWLLTPAEAPYGSAGSGSRYQGQVGPTASRFYEGFKTWPAP